MGFPPESFSHLGSGLPKWKQPLRKDAPYNLPSPAYPRKPRGEPTDIEDFISDVRENIFFVCIVLFIFHASQVNEKGNNIKSNRDTVEAAIIIKYK